MYTCQTCQAALDDVETGRHLSLTRHKSVKYDEIDEVVECEECGDQNIHQLSLLRYGLSDMELLCLMCLAKGEKTSTQYTLSNGSLLKMLPQYYKFRDIECAFCQGDRYLNVGTTNDGQQIVLCRKCLVEHKSEFNKPFVSESDDTFLKALLGITEFTPSKAKRSRKVGRKGGRMASRRPRKDDPGAEERRAHYLATKATTSAIKSGKTVQAVGSTDVKALLKGKNERGKSSARGGGAYKGGSASRGGSKPTSANSSRASSKPSTRANSALPSRAHTPVPDKQNGRDSPKPKREGRVSPGGGKEEAKKPREMKLDAKQGAKEKKGIEKKLLEKQNGKLKKQEKPEKLKPEKLKPEKLKPEKLDKPEKLEKLEKLKPEKLKAEKPEKEETIVYPPGIVKYEPSKEPLLSYPSMQKYFEEISYNLFLEEKINARMARTPLVQCSEVTLEWFADQDKKNKQFKVTVLLTDDFTNKYVSKSMQSLGKLPFQVGQTMMLMAGDDIAWYGSVATQDAYSATKSRLRNGPKVMELVIQLYPWNTMPLPRTMNTKHLRILPCSVPVSRVFMAMTKLENPRFIDMLLGQKPIRQINFRNFLKYTKDTFNESQKVAVQHVLNNPITVLQGPPGTGKTSTIHEIVLQLLENLHTYPVLVVAAANIAIDNIAEKLIEKHGRNILRIVALEKEAEYNKDHPLASICLHNKVYDSLSLHEKEVLRDLRNPRVKVSQNQYKKLLTRQIDLSDTLVAQAKVIFTTSVVAGGNKLRSIKKIPVVIMDEATQSSEPTTLIPLSMPGVDKFVFVGDQKQLSSFSQVPSLSTSLFERVLLNGTYKTPHMLDTQYRMHPAISAFPKHKFYDDKLKDGITAEHRKMDGIPENPVYCWDTEGKHPEGHVIVGFREDRGFTYVNRGEVDLVTQAVLHLVYQKGVARENIGVITPYSGQRDLLSSVMVKNELVNPAKEEVKVEEDRDDIDTVKKSSIHSVSGIMIASIDAFQGREKDFMVMSCVRSNPNNKVGFLSDERRLNVALTRAKYGLIVIGDVECLSQGDGVWKEYLDGLKAAGSIHRTDTINY